jgi:succinate-semialdehyde dehydrogenase/glutarate-semialdehyde dehydrogenase
VHAILDDIEIGLSIAGEVRGSSAGSSFDVFDPASGEVIAEVPDGTVADGIDAVGAAAAALKVWSATAPRVRGEVLRRAFEIMMARQETLARIIVLENGKTLTDARGEVAYAAEFFRWYSEEAVRNAGEVSQAPNGANRIMVVHQPIGVALLITPWNFPAAMLTRKIGPALAAGCTVVTKPASETPLTAFAIIQILREAGMPADVVNVVTTKRSGEVIGAMLADGRVRKLSFTGSTEVGSRLLELAAPQVTNCSMELGGNAPFIVFADADVDEAVAGAMVAKMRNGGEACTAANRFYVESPIAERFTASLAKAMGELRLGSGLDESVQLGPLINAGARTTVSSLVDDAVGAGARIVTGGSAPDRVGFFYEPTVLTDVRPGAAIIETEIFGPVAPIVTFEQEDEVVGYANSCDVGLASYVFTRDLARGLRVAEAIEAGMVGINRGLVSDPAAPFGGSKRSGLGREGGREGIREYLETKYIAVDW